MQWRPVFEQAALGFLGSGALCLFVSRNPIHFLLLASGGMLINALYTFLRPLPWGRYFQNSTSACVSVSYTLYFREVSLQAPERMAFIRFQNLGKKELFEKLNGKRLNPDTIPYHMRVAIEEKRALDLPWEAVEPYLMAVQ